MATIILRQSSVVSDPSATIKGSPLSNAEVDNNFANINISIGVLSNLTTSGKANTVVAINELKSNVGVLSDLTTNGKANIVFSVNELKSNIGNLTNLTTNGTANLVVAVNELRSNITISDDTTTNTTFYPIIADATSGVVTSKVSSTKLTFNPSSGLLTSTDYNSSSDVALKDNIKDINNPLDLLSQLHGYSFTWKETGDKSFGLSAQEVEKVLPEIVRNRPDGFKGINYLNIIAILIEAVKELKEEIKLLKSDK